MLGGHVVLLSNLATKANEGRRQVKPLKFTFTFISILSISTAKACTRARPKHYLPTVEGKGK